MCETTEGTSLLIGKGLSAPTVIAQDRVGTRLRGLFQIRDLRPTYMCARQHLEYQGKLLLRMRPNASLLSQLLPEV